MTWRDYFSAEGRLPRLRYFGYSMLVFGVNLVAWLLFLSSIAADSAASMFVTGTVLFAAVVLGCWSSVVISIKRLHDLGMAGTNIIWILLLGLAGGVLGEASAALGGLMCIASFGVSLWMLFAPGEDHPNVYGEVPR